MKFAHHLKHFLWKKTSIALREDPLFVEEGHFAVGEVAGFEAGFVDEWFGCFGCLLESAVAVG